VVGEALQHSRFKQGITHAMHVVGEANAYVAEMQPWKLAKAIKTAKAGAAAGAGVDSATDAEDVVALEDRLATVLWVALQVVSDANTLLTPYIPNIAQQVHETLGRTGVWAAHPQVVEVADDMPADVVGVGVPQAGRTYPVIMGDYGNQQAVWRRTPVEPGTALQKPKPLIAKLDPELGETGPKWAPVSGKA
jgi:methionine--tRNA ligase